MITVVTHALDNYDMNQCPCGNTISLKTLPDDAKYTFVPDALIAQHATDVPFLDLNCRHYPEQVQRIMQCVRCGGLLMLDVRNSLRHVDGDNEIECDVVESTYTFRPDMTGIDYLMDTGTADMPRGTSGYLYTDEFASRLRHDWMRGDIDRLMNDPYQGPTPEIVTSRILDWESAVSGHSFRGWWRATISTKQILTFRPSRQQDHSYEFHTLWERDAQIEDTRISGNSNQTTHTPQSALQTTGDGIHARNGAIHPQRDYEPWSKYVVARLALKCANNDARLHVVRPFAQGLVIGLQSDGIPRSALNSLLETGDDSELMEYGIQHLLQFADGWTMQVAWNPQHIRDGSVVRIHGAYAASLAMLLNRVRLPLIERHDTNVVFAIPDDRNFLYSTNAAGTVRDKVSQLCHILRHYIPYPQDDGDFLAGAPDFRSNGIFQYQGKRIRQVGDALHRPEATQSTISVSHSEYRTVWLANMRDVIWANLAFDLVGHFYESVGVHLADREHSALVQQLKAIDQFGPYIVAFNAVRTLRARRVPIGSDLALAFIRSEGVSLSHKSDRTMFLRLIACLLNHKARY